MAVASEERLAMVTDSISDWMRKVRCGRCQSGLCLTLTNGLAGLTSISSDPTGGGDDGCTQRYMLADDVEDAVVSFCRTVQLKPERVKRLPERLIPEVS
jgi:hypothetical protein